MGPRRKGTLIIGTHVRLSAQADRAVTHPHIARMLNLYTDILPDPYFLAVYDEERSGESICDLSRVRWLRDKKSVGLVRVLGLPVFVWRLVSAMRERELLYARLPDPEGRLACKLARIFNWPYFVSIHADAGELMRWRAWSGPRALRWWRQRRAGWIENSIRVSCSSALTVFSVSESLERKYRREGPGWQIVRHFMHVREDVVARQDATQCDKPIEGPPRVLFVGALREHKGIYVLMEAAALICKEKRTNGLDVVFCGDGPERGRLEALVEDMECGIENFSGRVAGWTTPGRELEREYGNATVAVLPSLGGEGTPKALIEAMLLGVPCIGSDSGGTADLLGNGERGWVVKAGDVYELADAITVACRDEDKRQKVLERGRSYVLAHDWRTGRNRVEQVLKTLGFAE